MSATTSTTSPAPAGEPDAQGSGASRGKGRTIVLSVVALVVLLSVVRAISGADDLTSTVVRGLHFGAAIAEGEPTGAELAAVEIADWLASRFPTAPPT